MERKTRYPLIVLRKSYRKYDWYELVFACVFKFKDLEVIIPSGFTTDFASVPQLFWGLVPPHGHAAMPAVIHDYLCEFGVFPRWKCDLIFFELLKQTPMRTWQIWLMYGYIRIFGWIRYKKRT